MLRVKLQAIVELVMLIGTLPARRNDRSSLQLDGQNEWTNERFERLTEQVP